jgi:hypothetical protein
VIFAAEKGQTKKAEGEQTAAQHNGVINFEPAAKPRAFVDRHEQAGGFLGDSKPRLSRLVEHPGQGGRGEG